MRKFFANLPRQNGKICRFIFYDSHQQCKGFVQKNVNAFVATLETIFPQKSRQHLRAQRIGPRKNIFAFIEDGGDERDFHEKELSWRLFSVAITTDG
jgi:hypothetical protein